MLLLIQHGHEGGCSSIAGLGSNELSLLRATVVVGVAMDGAATRATMMDRSDGLLRRRMETVVYNAIVHSPGRALVKLLLVLL